MRRLSLSVLVLTFSLLSISLPPSVAASNTPGVRCARAGTTAKPGITSVKCLKGETKLIWQKVAVVKVISPKATPRLATLTVQLLNIPKGSNVALAISQISPKVKGKKLFTKTLTASTVLKNLPLGRYGLRLNRTSVKSAEGHFLGFLSASTVTLVANQKAVVKANFKTFIPNNTVAIAKPQVQAVTALTDTSIQVQLLRTQLPNPVVGEYLLLGTSAQIPGGFVGKVMATDNGAVTLQAASIFDAIPQASIDASTVIPQDQLVVTPIDSGSIHLRTQGTYLRANTFSGIHQSVNPFELSCKATSGITFLQTISLSVEPHLSLDWSVSPKGVVINSAGVSLVSTLSSQGGIEANGLIACAATLSTQLPVPIVVLGIPFFVTLSGGLFLDGEVTAGTVSDLSYSLTTGFTYENGMGFHEVYQAGTASESTAEVAAKLEFGLTGGVTVRPGMEKPLDISIPNALNLNADLTLGIDNAKLGMQYKFSKNDTGTDESRALFFEAGVGVTAHASGSIKAFFMTNTTSANFAAIDHLGRFTHPLGSVHIPSKPTPSTTPTPTPSPSQQLQTLSVNLSANKDSRATLLNGMNLTASVTGSAQGTINYTFYCDRSDSGTDITSGWDAKFDDVFDNSKTATCNYPNSGTYTAKVIVERGTFQAEARATIKVTANATTSTLVRIIADNLGCYTQNSDGKPPLGAIVGVSSGVNIPTTGWNITSVLRRGDVLKYVDGAATFSMSIFFPESLRTYEVELPDGKKCWVVAQWSLGFNSPINLSEVISPENFSSTLPAPLLFPGVQGTWRGSWKNDGSGNSGTFEFQITDSDSITFGGAGSETSNNRTRSFNIGGSVFGDYVFFIKTYPDSNDSLTYEGKYNGNSLEGLWNIFTGSAGDWSMTRAN